MFAARGIAVSFSVFVLVYCALSIAVCFVWRSLLLHARHYPVGRIADLLFALRILPLATAAVITAAFTVPSFLLPRAAGHRRAHWRDSPGTRPLRCCPWDLRSAERGLGDKTRFPRYHRMDPRRSANRSLRPGAGFADYASRTRHDRRRDCPS